MRSGRIKVWGEVAVYHCISRVVAGERLLDDRAKEMFRRMLWKAAAFCGVEVLAYCVMSNHVHVLVRIVPKDDAEPLDRNELLLRYRAFYGEVPGSPGFPAVEVLGAIFAEGGERADRWEGRLRARMSDVSEFMKTLKQRFTIWYNRTYRRFGTLWAERFKSVLVENSAFALKTVAAYIDLNPVRGGLAEDPADYRWCSYAEALGGGQAAREGLCRVVDIVESKADWRNGLELYRMVLFGKGGVARQEGQGRLSEERVRAVLDGHGKLSREELLRTRIRYFTDGAILGSREFVHSMGAKWGERSATSWSGSPEKPLGKIPATLDGEEDLSSWRRLRKQAIG